MTIAELKALTDREFLAYNWGDNILTVIDRQNTVQMTMKEFLSHCTACGGNWGGMLLTGIKKLYPAVWEAIPDNMGSFAWACLCNTLKLLGVEPD
jgi:hypothetical protein